MVGRPRDPNRKLPVTVRLRPALRQKLWDAAEKKDVTASEIVVQAIEAYLRKVA